MCSRSMAVPAKPKIAGNRVSAAASTKATATIVASREAVHERQAHHEQPEQGDDHRGPGEEHGAPGRGQGHDGGVPGRSSFGQSLAVAGDDEQGVVDADTEADHDHHVRAEGGHGDEVAERHEDPEAHAHPDQGGEDRQAHGHHRPEGQQHDHHGGQRARSSRSTRVRPRRPARPVRPRPPPADPAGRSRGRCRSPAGRRSQAGPRPWRRTGPPRSRSGGRATAARWRQGPSGLCTPETCARGCRDLTSRSMAAALAGLSSGAGERRTTSALSPFWDGNRLARRFWACCEGELPRAKLLSSRLPAHCASPMTATTASSQPASTRRRWS